MRGVLRKVCQRGTGISNHNPINISAGNDAADEVPRNRNMKVSDHLALPPGHGVGVDVDTRAGELRVHTRDNHDQDGAGLDDVLEGRKANGHNAGANDDGGPKDARMTESGNSCAKTASSIASP